MSCWNCGSQVAQGAELCGECEVPINVNAARATEYKEYLWGAWVDGNLDDGEVRALQELQEDYGINRELHKALMRPIERWVKRRIPLAAQVNMGATVDFQHGGNCTLPVRINNPSDRSCKKLYLYWMTTKGALNEVRPRALDFGKSQDYNFVFTPEVFGGLEIEGAVIAEQAGGHRTCYEFRTTVQVAPKSQGPQTVQIHQTTHNTTNIESAMKIGATGGASDPAMPPAASSKVAYQATVEWVDLELEPVRDETVMNWLRSVKFGSQPVSHLTGEQPIVGEDSLITQRPQSLTPQAVPAAAPPAAAPPAAAPPAAAPPAAAPPAAAPPAAAMPSAMLGAFNKMRVSLRWDGEADFDLFAVYQSKTGKNGIVYYNDLGQLSRFPWMQLDEDAQGAAEDDQNEENLTIAQLDEMAKVWICCWDYDQVKSGRRCHFDDYAVELEFKTDRGDRYQFELGMVADGNTANLVTLCNTDFGVEIQRSPKSLTLDGLNPGTLMRFLKS